MATATKLTKTTDLDHLCINTIRTLSLDAVQKAEFGASGFAARDGSGGVCAVDKVSAAQPEEPEVVQPRSVFAVGRARVDAALQLAAPDGLRSAAGRAEAFSAASFENAGASGKYFDARRRDHDRAARAGICEWRRDGHRAEASRGDVQPQGLPGRSTISSTASARTAI